MLTPLKLIALLSILCISLKLKGQPTPGTLPSAVYTGQYYRWLHWGEFQEGVWLKSPITPNISGIVTSNGLEIIDNSGAVTAFNGGLYYNAPSRRFFIAFRKPNGMWINLTVDTSHGLYFSHDADDPLFVVDTLGHVRMPKLPDKLIAFNKLIYTDAFGNLAKGDMPSGTTSDFLVVDNMAALRTTDNVGGKPIYVRGYYTPADGGGGWFDWRPTSLKIVMQGMIEQVTGQVLGRWERFYTGGNFNYLWFGAYRDSITYNYGLQGTMDWIAANYFGQTLFFPRGYYRDTSHAMAVTGCNLLGDNMMSEVFNDIPTREPAAFGYQIPIRLGNMGPRDWDDIKWLRGDSVKSTKAYVPHADIAAGVYKKGAIIIIKSVDHWTNTKGLLKPYVVRINRIMDINNDTLYLEHPMDTSLVQGDSIAVDGVFKNQVNMTDSYGRAKKFIADITVQGMSLRSQYGQMSLGNMLYQCAFREIKTYGFESLGGNGEAWCTFDWIYGKFWKQAWETSIGSHNTRVNNVYMTWINRVDGLKGKQPCIKFGENVYDVVLSNFTVDGGTMDRRGLWFGAATNCGFINSVIRGVNMVNNIIQLSTTDDEEDDIVETYVQSHVINNFVTNCRFYGGNTPNYVYCFKPAIGSRLEGNRIENCVFYGKIRTATALVFDGDRTSLSNVMFEQGSMSFGDSVKNGSLENVMVDNPALYNAKVQYRNVYSKLEVFNRTTTLSFTGITPSSLMPNVLYAEDSTKLWYRGGFQQPPVNMLGSDYRPAAAQTLTDVTTNVVTAATTGLSVALSANRKYRIVAVLGTNCSGTGGMGFTFTAPVGSFFNIGQELGSGTAANNPVSIKMNGFGSITTPGINRFSGNGSVNIVAYVTVGSTAGTLDLQFASLVAAETSTIRANSMMDAIEIRTVAP